MVYLCATMISLLLMLGACTTPVPSASITPVPVRTDTSIAVAPPTKTPTPVASPNPAPVANHDKATDFADVVEVSARGKTGSYSFSVTVRSPDTGCTQYSDWWEVLTEDGELIYRRVLAHSHTEEQPFTRSGSPVEVDEEQTVIVRAHMSTSGYGGVAMEGSVSGGFNEVAVDPQFALEIEDQQPLPGSCAF